LETTHNLFLKGKTMSLTAIEVELIAIGIDALGKVLEGHTGGAQATEADVDAAKARLDKTKADLDHAIDSRTDTSQEQG
jgi:hypothetical protein